MAQWQAADNLQVIVDGRRADVASVKYGDGGAWVDTSQVLAAVVSAPPPPPPTGSLPAAPAGYTTFYEVDFRSIGATLPADWSARVSGPGNNAATWRAQNVAVVPGTGLVHTAERDYVGATIYSGAVNGRIAVPQFRHIRFSARCEGFKSGTWPSFWERPQSGGAMQGEKDHLEAFGGHIPPSSYPRVFGGGYIATSSNPYSLGNDTIDFKLPESQWNSTHVYDSRQVPGLVTMWVDGSQKGTLQKSGMSTTEARNAWDPQFEDPAATWYLRTDFQISGTGSQAGVTNAGPLSSDQVGQFARWIIEWVQVFVPTS